MTVRFEIPGAPEGKGRPRFNGRTGRTYTPQKTKCYEELVRECYRSQCTDGFPSDAALRVEILAAYPLLKSDSKADKKKKLAWLLKPIKKPDWDNIGKIVCDALNGVAYHDDAQITYAVVCKRYAEHASVRVLLTTDDALACAASE